MVHDIIDNRTRDLAPEIVNFLADSDSTQGLHIRAETAASIQASLVLME